MPMPQPFQFRTIDQLHKTLASKRIQKEFKSFFKRKYDDPDELIRDSVGRNTIRAFHHSSYGIPIGPLEVYREWAAKFVAREFSNWRKIETKVEMHEFVLKNARKMRSDWLKRTARKGSDGYNIGIGRAAKLLNLLLKYLTLWSELSKKDHKRLIRLLDVPLDSYTLQGIRRLHKAVKIPMKASMGFVKSENQYIDLQECIAKLCRPSHLPVEYEIAAWDTSH